MNHYNIYFKNRQKSLSVEAKTLVIKDGYVCLLDAHRCNLAIFTTNELLAIVDRSILKKDQLEELEGTDANNNGCV